MRGFVYRAARAVKLLARDGRIPRPLRWLVVFGLLPIPGPLDEAVLLIAAGLLGLFYRDRMREAWRAAEGERFAQQKRLFCRGYRPS